MSSTTHTMVDVSHLPKAEEHPATGERVNANIPWTFREMSPEEIVKARHVKAYPFYHTPVGPNFTQATKSPWGFEGQAYEVIGAGVLVNLGWGHPGSQEQLFFPYEIHRGSCNCHGCVTLLLISF